MSSMHLKMGITKDKQCCNSHNGAYCICQISHNICYITAIFFGAAVPVTVSAFFYTALTSLVVDLFYFNLLDTIISDYV